MRFCIIAGVALVLASAGQAQELVEVPVSQANVSRPDDLFNLPPGQWHMAKSLALGAEPCTPEQCEAGFTSGELVISVEHAKTYVQIIAGFRQCERTAFAEVEVGTKAGKSKFGEVERVRKKVLKGLAKTCAMTAPDVPKLDVASLFPKPAVPTG
jgi:hypothetical protein